MYGSLWEGGFCGVLIIIIKIIKRQKKKKKGEKDMSL
jgi:hypothetical protein